MGEGEMPSPIQYLLDNVDIVEAPDEGNEIVRETYARMHRHECMLCGGSLGKDTMIALNQYGVFVMVCGGACFTDLPVMHWLQEQHETMSEAINFRGGQVDPDAPDEADTGGE